MHFHETLTRGWMRLLVARNERTFTEFAETGARAHENPLHEYWSPDALRSDAARTTFIAPDRAPLPPISPRWRPNVPHLRDRRRTVALHVDPPARRKESCRSKQPQSAVHWRRHGNQR